MDDDILLCDLYKVSYAPSVSFFSPKDTAITNSRPFSIMLLDSSNRLLGPVWECDRFQKRLGSNRIKILDAYDGTVEELNAIWAEADIIHVATHGRMFTDTPDESGIELHRGRILTIRDIQQMTLKDGSLVFLNACSSSKVAIQSRIQFASIANAFLAAGAATVIATYWRTDDVAAALISDCFYNLLLHERRGRIESLNLALQWIRTVSIDEIRKMELGKLALFLPISGDQPYQNPFYWGPFALFGHW
jgi:CHAT domain-containing protein